MSDFDREGLIARIERIYELIASVEKTCDESADNRRAFDDVRKELRAAHDALRVERRKHFR